MPGEGTPPPRDRRDYRTRVTGWAAVALELIRSERAMCRAAFFLALMSTFLLLGHLAGVPMDIGPFHLGPHAVPTATPNP